MTTVWFGLTYKHGEMASIYQNIISSIGLRKQIALLLDPDKQNIVDLKRILELTNNSSVSFILIGGSLVNSNIDEFIHTVKQNTQSNQSTHVL